MKVTVCGRFQRPVPNERRSIVALILNKSVHTLMKTLNAKIFMACFAALLSSASAFAGDGNSGGGGGYVDENSTRILIMAAKGLGQMIRAASPDLFQKLPPGWDQKKLASIIENVRYFPNVNRSRDGRQLMFDYGKDKKGPYIVALKPFFEAYSSFPIKFAKPQTINDMMKDVRLKLIHETGHLIQVNGRGLDEVKAELFGMSVLNALASDMIVCQTSDVGSWPGALIPKDKTVKPSYGFVIHRPTGVGVANTTASWEQSYSTGNESSRFTELHKLAANELYADREIEINTGHRNTCFPGYDSNYLWDNTCFGPAQRPYDFTMTIEPSGEITYRAAHPLADDEYLKLDAAGNAVVKYNVGNRLGSFSLQCMPWSKAIEMP